MKYTMRSVEEKRELVSRWRASGLSSSLFARRHGFSPTSLREWSRTLESSPQATTSFLQVELVEPTSASPLVVEVARSGHRVFVPPGFDAGELQRLVRALC